MRYEYKPFHCDGRPSALGPALKMREQCDQDDYRNRYANEPEKD
jgi:hypothetical protein